jgi:2-keto-4-pentenoate hydratase/2-oxohepta-3-ene-1,7-dioic acid hydratase in catechol pathway
MTLWVRFARADATEGWGVREGDAIAVQSDAPWAEPIATGETLAAGDVRLLAPVQPRRFIGLWNNFHAMSAKTGAGIPEFPLYFLKSPGSLLDPDGIIRPPATYTGRVLYEGELGIVIGRPCSNLDEADAEAAICGYTCVNDVTALDLFGADPGFSQWARAKGCDSFGPVGPAIATGLDWSSLTIRVALNGRERQNYPASDMIIPPARIVSLISQEMTLQPGDLIACGTSIGALPMRPGMVVEVTIDGIGTLRNTMTASAPG